MNKKNQQLYVKNEKGRYEPYKAPKVYDNKLYRRLPNGKYEAVGMHVESNMLTEGVWVISKKRSCTSYTPSSYLRSQYHLEKVSDLQNPLLQLNLAQLGNVDKVLEEVYFDSMFTDKSRIENFKAMVADIINKLNTKNNERDSKEG